MNKIRLGTGVSAVLLSVLSGCNLPGFSNREGASEATAAFVNSFDTSAGANKTLLPSGMSRMSGVETVNKLITIFPTASTFDSDQGYDQNNPNNNGWYYGDDALMSNPKMQVSMRIIASTDQIDPEAYRQNIYAQPEWARIADHSQWSQVREGLIALRGMDRATDALTLLKIRPFFENLCKQAQANPSRTVLFTESPSLLASGESFPQDPSTKVAFIVARRAWNFPYTADSPEVAVLKTLYDRAPENDRRRAVCMAAIMSSQFWEGNPGKLDIPNRVALSLASVRPTIQQLYEFSKNPTAFKNYLKNLQSTHDYLSTILRWHGQRLGLRGIGIDFDAHYEMPFDARKFTSSVFTYRSANFGPANSASAASLPKIVGSRQDAIDGCAEPVQPDKDWTQTAGGKALHSVPPSLSQPFDPRTTGIVWEDYDPSVNRYKVIAAWVLKPFLAQYKTAVHDTGLSDADFMSAYSCESFEEDPRWLRCKGELWNGARYSLEQIRQWNAAENGVAPTDCPNCTLFQTPKFPMNTDFAVTNRYFRTMRAVRYSPSGRQDGYSPVKNYYSNKTYYACNSFARLTATCAYEETTKQLVPDVYRYSNFLNFYGQPNTYGDYSRNWTAAYNVNWINPWETSGPSGFVKTYRPFLHIGGDRGAHNQGPAFQTYANPLAISNFRCGMPNKQEFAKSGPGLDYKAAFPGYEYLSAYSAGDENSTAWLPASWKNGSGVAQSSLHDVLPRGLLSANIDGDLRNTAETDTLIGSADFIYELNLEPYRLIESAITGKNPVSGQALPGGKGDYAMIVSAPYTFISKRLELMYRSMGGISYLPEGYIPPDNVSNDWTTVSQVFTSGQSQPFTRFPKKMYGDPNWNQGGGYYEFDRPKAGILQMPATLAPMDGGSVRSIASRVYARFLCGEPSMYDPNTDGKYDAHLASFARMSEQAIEPNTYRTAGEQAQMRAFMANHLNRKDCMTCHINLDPTGMALFKYYGSNLVRKEGVAGAGSEIGFALYTGGLRMPVAIQSVSNDENKGVGMFLGEEVRGFGGVTARMVQRREFWSCSTETAFQNMFGRLPSSLEAKRALKRVVDQFMTDHDYNNMILGLVEIQQNLDGE